jgi:hypothetical protein
LSFTVTELERADPRTFKYRAAVGGIVSYARYLEQPTPRKPYNVAFGPVVLDKPFDLHPGVESVVLWAMGGGHGVNLAKQDEVDRQIKRLPWVMILRLNVEKLQP